MAITKMESMRDFLRIWFSWQRQAVFIFFLIVGLVMAYAYTVTPQYQSSADILVLPKTTEGEVISAGRDETKIRPVTPRDVFTEMSLIDSEKVLKETVKSFGTSGLGLRDKNSSIFSTIVSPIKGAIKGVLRLVGLMPAPLSNIEAQVSILRGAISIESITDSEIVSVSLRAENPQRANIVLTKVLEAYLNQRNAIFTQEKGQGFYNDQAMKSKKNLASAEDELKYFQREENILNLQGQNQANIDLLSLLTNDLNLLEISYDENSGRLDMLKQNLLDDSDTLSFTKDMRNLPSIIELEKGIVPLLIKRSRLSQTYTPTSREITSISSQIKVLNTEIRKEIGKAIKTDELELKSLSIKIQSLKGQISRIRHEANEFNQKKNKLEELIRKVTMYKDSFLLYSTKTANSKVFAEKINRNLTNVTIASPPTIPERPISPNRMLLLILSLFSGALVALFIPFILESLDNKLKTADDAEALLELPVVCSFSDLDQ